MRFNLDSYETVEARLAKFWEMFPNGRIATYIHHYDDSKVVFRAEAYKDMLDMEPVSSGYAEEIRDASPVNRTSHVENAETSAIGRALANFIFQSKTAPRPSREEMTKVVRTQEPRPDADLLTKFREACKKSGLDPENVAKQAGVDLNELTDSSMPKLRDAFKQMQQPQQPKVESGASLMETVKQVFPEAQVSSDEPKIKNPNEKASNAQIGKLRAMLMGTGSGPRSAQTEAVSEILNRTVDKLDSLTKGEANQCIKVIETRLNRG